MTKKKLGCLAATAIATAFAARSEAVTMIWVPDLSQLSFQNYPDGKVYLRNLNTFSSSALGCCYNYYIDATSQDGKNTWALILSFMAQQKGAWMGIPDSMATGNVSYVGVW